MVTKRTGIWFVLKQKLKDEELLREVSFLKVKHSSTNNEISYAQFTPSIPMLFKEINL